MPTKSFLVGFFRLPGVAEQVIVETPLTGAGKNDYRMLHHEVLKLFPKTPEGQITRLGSVIETRDSTEDAWINPTPGMTLRQIFPEDAEGKAEEFSRNVGTVFFSGAACKISLRYHVEKAQVGVVLIDRMTKHSTRFADRFNSALLVSELPKLLADTFGAESKDMKLRMKTYAPERGRERVPNLNESPAQ